jgi:hypothetical protein
VPSPRSLLTASTARDRHAVLTGLADAVTGAGGWSAETKLFSNPSAMLGCALPAAAAERCGPVLPGLGLLLDPAARASRWPRRASSRPKRWPSRYRSASPAADPSAATPSPPCRAKRAR